MVVAKHRACLISGLLCPKRDLGDSMVTCIARCYPLISLVLLMEGPVVAEECGEAAAHLNRGEISVEGQLLDLEFLD